MALKDLTEEDYKNIIKNFNTEPIPAWQSLRVYITSAIDEGRLDAQVKPEIAEGLTTEELIKAFYLCYLYLSCDIDVRTDMEKKYKPVYDKLKESKFIR